MSSKWYRALLSLMVVALCAVAYGAYRLRLPIDLTLLIVEIVGIIYMCLGKLFIARIFEAEARERGDTPEVRPLFMFVRSWTRVIMGWAPVILFTLAFRFNYWGGLIDIAPVLWFFSIAFLEFYVLKVFERRCRER